MTREEFYAIVPKHVTIELDGYDLHFDGTPSGIRSLAYGDCAIAVVPETNTDPVAGISSIYVLRAERQGLTDEELISSAYQMPVVEGLLYSPLRVISVTGSMLTYVLLLTKIQHTVDINSDGPLGKVTIH